MDRTDVAILGGGLAGLTLAVQLRRRLPELHITILDRRIRPIAEQTSTVGESFAEVASHYLREVVGLRHHLESEQLPKFGLRFFVGSDPDFADRFEIGLLDPAISAPVDGRITGLPLPTHQADRARLENELANRCRAGGIEMIEGTEIEGVSLDPNGHRIFLGREGPDHLDARWVVFAGGSNTPGLPAQRRSLGHRVRAAWLRVEGDLDIGTWSSRESFFQRTPPGFRRLSTTHLMGRGYWIWIIPLPSGVTSIGVVADPEVVDFAPADLHGLLQWLEYRDPRIHAELSAAVPAGEGDFHVTDVDASIASTCFSDKRWAVVGGAAALVDVLYSPGADLIAVGNSLVTDLVERELDTGSVRGHCAVAERVFGGFADGLAELYRGQYQHFDNAGQVASKVVWDSALYFGFHALLFRHGLFGDPRFLAEIRPELVAVQSLQARVQGRMRSGDIKPLFELGDSPVEWGGIDWLMENYYGAEAQPDQRAVLQQLRRGMSALERMARSFEGGT